MLFRSHSKFLEWSHAGRPEIPGFQECCGLRDQVISIQDVLTLSPTVVNEFRAGYPRNRRIRIFEQHDRNYAKEMGILGTSTDVDPAFWGYPKAYVPGYSNFGTNAAMGATIQDRTQGFWTVTDILSVQKGNHALKMGGDAFRQYSAKMFYYSDITGRFYFTGSATGDAFARTFCWAISTGAVAPRQHPAPL